MQFGRVLAFATLVLASPTPMNLEARDVPVEVRGASFSISGITSDITSAVSNINTINNILSGNQANIVAALAAAIAGLNTTADAVYTAGTTSVKALEGSVTAAGKIIVSDIKGTIANLTQLTATLTAAINATANGNLVALQSDVTNLYTAVTTLINTLALTNLNGLLTLTASASTNAEQVFAQEVANLQALINPFVTTLKSLQVALSGSVGTTVLAVASSVANALSTFVGQALQTVPTISA